MEKLVFLFWQPGICQQLHHVAKVITTETKNIQNLDKQAAPVLVSTNTVVFSRFGVCFLISYSFQTITYSAIHKTPDNMEKQETP